MPPPLDYSVPLTLVRMSGNLSPTEFMELNEVQFHGYLQAINLIREQNAKLQAHFTIKLLCEAFKAD